MLRKKPDDTSISEAAWIKFNEIADYESYGEYTEDWMNWFLAFEAGYVARMEE